MNAHHRLKRVRVHPPRVVRSLACTWAPAHKQFQRERRMWACLAANRMRALVERQEGHRR